MKMIKSTTTPTKTDPSILSCFSTERALLGGLLLKPEAFDSLEELAPSDFYHPTHQVIFEHLSASLQRDTPLDMILFLEKLNKVGKLDEAGGEKYLWELAHEATGIHLAHYAKIIREKSALRKMLKIGQSIVEKSQLLDDLSLEEKLSWMEEQVFNWRDPRQQVNPILSGRLLYAALLDTINQAGLQDFPGLKTGFVDLDHLTLGLKPENLIILAARPSMGKTTLALNIAAHVAKKEPILFFSLETPAKDLMLKVVCSERQLPLKELQQGKVNDAIGSALMSFSNDSLLENFNIEEPYHLSLADLRSSIRRFIRKQGRVGLVIVDYLQLMSIPGYSANQRVAEISEISRGLKSIAREFQVPVIALSQLNRELERRPDKRPMMADLRESGSIEQDADLIAFIYRDEVYNSDSMNRGAAEVIIAKNRHGQTGKVHLLFDGAHSQFNDKMAVSEYRR